MLVHPVGHDYRELAGNSSQEHVGLGRRMVSGSLARDAHVQFEMVDCPFNAGSDFIKVVPLGRIPLDAGEHAEVHVFIGIGGSPFFGGSAWLFAVADILSLYHVHFRAAPFDTVGTSLFLRDATVFHVKRRILGAGGIAVPVVADSFERALVTGVVRDEGLLETEIIFQETIDVGGVKGGIAEKRVRVKVRMRLEKVGKDGLKGRGIADCLVLFGGIRFFLDRNFRMVRLESIIEEDNVPDDAKAVGKQPELVRITKMPVDILLFGIRAGCGLGRHEAIGHLVGVDIRLVLVKGFQPFDERIEGLRVVFGNKKIYAGRVKGEDLGQRGVNELANRLGEVDHLPEHELDEGLKVLPKPREERGIGNLGETAEVTEFLAQ